MIVSALFGLCVLASAHCFNCLRNAIPPPQYRASAVIALFHETKLKFMQCKSVMLPVCRKSKEGAIKEIFRLRSKHAFAPDALTLRRKAYQKAIASIEYRNAPCTVAEWNAGKIIALSKSGELDVEHLVARARLELMFCVSFFLVRDDRRSHQRLAADQQAPVN